MGRSSQSLPGRPTVGYHLLGLTALSGEFPSDQLSRLPGGEAYKTNVVQALKQKRLLHTYYPGTAALRRGLFAGRD